MPIPAFEGNGDLPPGVYRTTFDEIVRRFGTGSRQREVVTQDLIRIHELAIATGEVQRLILFGSFVTAKAEPNDVDVVLIMHDSFRLASCDRVTRRIFDHVQAAEHFRATVFWIKPSTLFLDTMEEFIQKWQIKRDLTSRGIVEVMA